MKKIIDNQRGVTLIETVVATAIIAILLTTVLSTLLFGQKTIVFTDAKNNAASIAQKQIDATMAKISAGTVPTIGTVTETVDGYKTDLAVTAVDRDGNGTNEGYDIKVKAYYNNNESNVTLKAYVKKGGLGV